MKLNIEQRIWDYLDGNGTLEEREAIEVLIKTHAEYKSAFEALSSINNSLSSEELEEPSMGFTRNVMDKLELEPLPGSIKSLIDKRIIKGLFFFFLSTIALLLIVLVFQMDWSTYEEPKLPVVESLTFEVSGEMSGWAVKAFFFADIVIALYLFDHFLRRKLNISK